MANTDLALIYSNADGILEPIAIIETSRRGLKIAAYGYGVQEVADLVPQVADGTPFWKDAELYKRSLVQTHGTEGLPFDQGTVYFRWHTDKMKPTRPVSGVMTRLPPQEMPENWSTRIPTRRHSSRKYN